jgi:hypothetical protein
VIPKDSVHKQRVGKGTTLERLHKLANKGPGSEHRDPKGSNRQPESLANPDRLTIYAISTLLISPEKGLELKWRIVRTSEAPTKFELLVMQTTSQQHSESRAALVVVKAA